MGRPRVGNTRMRSPQAAAALGVTVRTLRLWIVKGLVPPPSTTTPTGPNYFTPEWLEEAKRKVEARDGHG